jgi:hypothetical protein
MHKITYVKLLRTSLDVVGLAECRGIQILTIRYFNSFGFLGRHPVFTPAF